MKRVPPANMTWSMQQFGANGHFAWILLSYYGTAERENSRKSQLTHHQDPFGLNIVGSALHSHCAPASHLQGNGTATRRVFYLILRAGYSHYLVCLVRCAVKSVRQQLEPYAAAAIPVSSRELST